MEARGRPLGAVGGSIGGHQAIRRPDPLGPEPDRAAATGATTSQRTAQGHADEPCARAPPPP
uniref:Uncharacterized protein n=1 Tax=Triticum urartu TaxID=4572 RepID=A0A8R7UHX4_TRIUA